MQSGVGRRRSIADQPTVQALGHLLVHQRQTNLICCGIGQAGRSSAIHFAAKQLIDAERRLFFPVLTADVHVSDALRVYHDRSENLVKPGVRELTHVAIEQTLGEIRPDLIVAAEDLGLVLVEIAVTHFVKSEKLEKAEQLDKPLLELDLSKLRNASFSELHELIFNRADNRRWLFYPGE